mmetsp:Transcript_45421/g.112816  ORF Transcript_45421/g.112816 Transcript_45421/m.112816 type:complete len:120 (-) Transcript_45421:585-944(-)
MPQDHYLQSLIKTDRQTHIHTQRERERERRKDMYTTKSIGAPTDASQWQTAARHSTAQHSTTGHVCVRVYVCVSAVEVATSLSNAPREQHPHIHIALTATHSTHAHTHVRLARQDLSLH